MEGVLSADPTVWEIMHGKLGTWDSHGRPYWERYQAGELGYDRFARMDVAVWRGAEAGLLREAAREVRWMNGCSEVLGALGEAGVTVAVPSEATGEVSVPHPHASSAKVKTHTTGRKLNLRLVMN